ncbi:hypothetical protein [Streptomyces phaeochromogenes]|uniref:hypothetical protein n=1 Tax=Streptomyces phaeochromogenes TaxID=1923 RepID=UPI003869FB81|nr:hypothetical protein OHB08_33370 [Streptomyces phaeochromogenes]
MTQTTDIMRGALQPTGHPHPLLVEGAVQAAVESADRHIAREYPAVAALLNDGAREHTHSDADAPAFVDGKATPEAAKVFADLAAQIAPAIKDAPDPQAAYAEVMQVWHNLLADTTGPLTTEQRTLVHDEGLGAWRTEPVETELRDIDDQRTRAENAETSFLGAEVVMTDYRSQAYGRQTEIWLRYGITIGTLTPARAREALDAIKGFVPYLEAVVELAEEIGANDFEGDPEIAAADREAETRRHRAITEARA